MASFSNITNHYSTTSHIDNSSGLDPDGLHDSTARREGSLIHEVVSLSPSQLQIFTSKFNNNDHQQPGESVIPFKHHINDDYSNQSLYFDYPKWYRWIILIASIIISILIGPSFFNFPPFSDMLYRNNAYAHLCHPSDETYELTIDNHGHSTVSCEAQQVQIASLYTAAVSVMFCFDLVAGILLDCFGSKIVSAVGISSQMLGWIFIGLSNETFNGYKTGMIMIAAGQEPAFFGLLKVGNLFPGYNSIVISLLGAARSTANATPLIMKSIQFNANISLAATAFFFCGLLGLCLLLILLFLPFRPYPQISSATKMPYTMSQNEISYRDFVNRKPRIQVSLFFSEAKTQSREFIQQAWTLPFILFCFIPMFGFIRSNYYGSSYSQHLSGSLSFYTLLIAISMLPAPVVGAFGDFVSNALVMTLLSSCGGLAMFFAMFDSVPLEYISSIFNYVFVSYISSQFYGYIAYNYPQEHMGKLIGVSLLLGGLVGLVATPMLNYSVKQNNFFPMDLIVVILQLVAVGISIYLHFRLELPKRRRLKQMKKQQQQEHEQLAQQLPFPPSSSYTTNNVGIIATTEG